MPKVNEGTAGDLNLIGWTGDYGDPDNFLGTFFRNFNPQFGFNNPAITGILNKALNEPNFAKRVKLYQQANDPDHEVPARHSVCARNSGARCREAHSRN